MKKFSVVFFLSVMLTFIFAPIIKSEGIVKTITTYVNSVNIKINDQSVSLANITYNNGTYVPIRDISELFGKKVVWNDTSRTINIVDNNLTKNYSENSEISMKSIMYILSMAFLIAGTILLAQMVFMRGKNDIAFISKFLASSNSSYYGARRILYETWLSKIGFFYVFIGLIIHTLFAKYYNSIEIVMRIVLISIVIFGLLLFGWWLSKNKTISQFPEILKASENF